MNLYGTLQVLFQYLKPGFLRLSFLTSLVLVRVLSVSSQHPLRPLGREGAEVVHSAAPAGNELIGLFRLKLSTGDLHNIMAREHLLPGSFSDSAPRPQPSAFPNL